MDGQKLIVDVQKKMYSGRPLFCKWTAKKKLDDRTFKVDVQKKNWTIVHLKWTAKKNWTIVHLKFVSGPSQKNWTIVHLTYVVGQNDTGRPK